MLVAIASGAIAGAAAGPATGAPGAQAAAKKAKVTSVAKSQKAILKNGTLGAVVKSRKRGKVRVRAQSSSFDSPRFSKLTKAKKVKFRKRGKRQVQLKLTKAGRNAVRSCQARTLRVRAGKASRTAKLKRNTNACSPKPVDLSNAACDFIGQQQGSLCMLPFPDDYHTVADPQSATGRRVDFSDAGTPQNQGGMPIAAEPYNLNDGFSPGQTIVVRVPGLDNPDALAATDPLPLDNLSRNDQERANEPVVVIDAETGERHPIWVELDSNAEQPAETALLIHPARNFDAGHRYIVAMRSLKNAGGNTVTAPNGFRYYRDALPSKRARINAQRPRFNSIFQRLRSAGIQRANLYLAWDFTVSSDENVAERMLHIRDDAFEQLGDSDLADLTVAGDAPEFDVTSVENFTPGENANMARRVQGTLEVPCYLEPDCAPGGRFDLGPDGLPSQNGTWTANFNCMLPRAAVDVPGNEPARPQLYGHGLLGSANEATSGAQQLLGQTHNFVVCATDEIGFSTADISNIATNILPDLGNFPELSDRVQQGLLNELYLGRLMIHADGFLSDAAFHVDDGDVGSDPVIDIARLYYNGNSQGGILGGALTAVAPDYTRASLGVPAMNYSVLLNRSVDFDLYKTILDPAYPNAMTQQLALSMIQMIWDRSDPNGYAHRMTSDPLPNTPAHEVLLNVAFGDHQVTTWQADVEARTIGAQAHEPVVYDGRWPDVDVLWGIPRIASYPYSGSAIVYWDSGPLRPNPSPPPDEIGTDPPPVENLPNRTGEDPHGDPRVAPEEMQMVSDFLQPNPQSMITDTCLGLPCFAGGFTGP